MDFSQLSLPQQGGAPTDPFKIFASLPRLSGAPNDLWRGQAEALAAWNDKRTLDDVLVSLNTGAGKTIVGLLIAQSLVNEGVNNVVYVCPTNDLVNQTADQAARIGLELTTRTEGGFSNDLFESGRACCVTNYAAVFNGLSAIRRRYFPGALIFDDAHVAESTMRDAFSIGLDRASHPDLFLALAAVFRPAFRELNRENQYARALDHSSPIPDSVLVPPEVVRANSVQLSSVLVSSGAASDQKLKYAYEHLKDHIDRCCFVFRAGKLEITPPFLPSLALDIFDRRLRRVYLSATLHNKADIVRAFGRVPQEIIEPSNDAGNGERLILLERELSSGNFDAPFVRTLSHQHKVVVAVPSYHKAADWSMVATPAPRESFTVKLEEFRRAALGSFILVSRVDGIDLPNDTCRLMVIDGVPRGESLLEKYQFEYLHMHNFAASRIANRLVQLFGRINRGRSDYGAFLVAGHDLNVWLNNDRNVALMPQLLRNQIMLGRHVQRSMPVRDLAKVQEILQTVLLSQPRNQSWLEYYSNFLRAYDVPAEKNEAAKRAENRNMEAAKAEALYAKYVWEGNYLAARNALDPGVADLARSDEKLAGWHNYWIGACLNYENRTEDAKYYYARARGQLGTNLIVDTALGSAGAIASTVRSSRLVGKLNIMLALGRESFEKQLSRVEAELAGLSGGSPKQMEEATRALGEFLGFESSRPDNEFDTGPDVLWADAETGDAIGFELKTDKAPGSQFSKDDISQSLDHLEWIKNHRPGGVLGVVLVGPSTSVSGQANPSEKLFSVGAEVVAGLRDKIIAIVRDGYEQPAGVRADWLEGAIADAWNLRALKAALCRTPLKVA